MGREAACTATWKRQRADGRALLETESVIFRGPFRVELRFDSLTRVETRGGTLSLETPAGTLVLALDEGEAERWADRIRNPPTLADKLGVTPGMHVIVVGVDDDAVVGMLRARAGRLTLGRIAKGADMIVCGLGRAADLRRFATLRAAIDPDGAIWTVRPKGVPEISEAAVRAAAREAGLVDVKVARVSATHTAEKFVIPKGSRRATPPLAGRGRSRPQPC